MNVDVGDKFFWFVFVELLCGFGASLAFIGLWSGYGYRYDGWRDSDNDWYEQRVSSDPKSRGRLDAPLEEMSRNIDYSLEVNATHNPETPKSTKDLQHASNGYSTDAVDKLMRLVGDSIERVRKVVPYARHHNTDHVLIHVLLPGGLIPVIFRSQMYAFKKDPGKAPTLTLMIIALVMYLVGGVILLIDGSGSDNTVHAIFAIVTGVMLIIDLIFLMIK